jgi:hypothetical protein
MLLPIPKSVKAHGKALERTLRSLLRQGFAEEVPVGLADEEWRSDHDGRYGLRITAAGLRAIGVPALASRLETEPGNDETRETTPAVPANSLHQLPPAPRPGSKLAKLITMLMQPDGRSVEELSQALGWQAHTTRAVISRLGKTGHVVVRTKNEAGVSVYRIEATADA